jgi:hypothetical protein
LHHANWQYIEVATPAGDIFSPGHDPQKWDPLLRQDHAQALDLAYFFDRVIPPERNCAEVTFVDPPVANVLMEGGPSLACPFL